MTRVRRTVKQLILDKERELEALRAKAASMETAKKDPVRARLHRAVYALRSLHTASSAHAEYAPLASVATHCLALIDSARPTEGAP